MVRSTDNIKEIVTVIKAIEYNIERDKALLKKFRKEYKILMKIIKREERNTLGWYSELGDWSKNPYGRF